MKDLPVGYFGGRARLYNSSGNLATASGWTYNAVKIGGLSFTTDNFYTSSGTYFSKGEVQIYNGNGYNTYTTNQSPYVQMFTSKTAYQVNENNEIYGSELILEQFNIKPDLISAIGDNNIAGYVKAIDLEDDIPATLEEAIEYQKNLQDERQIPLYESDGETIIGIFTIHYNLTEEFKN